MHNLYNIRGVISVTCSSFIPLKYPYFSVYCPMQLLHLTHCGTCKKSILVEIRLLHPISSWTLLCAVLMDNSNAVDKSGIVNFSKFSSTTPAAFISLLYVLGQLVQLASWMSVQPFLNPPPFAKLLYSLCRYHMLT